MLSVVWSRGTDAEYRRGSGPRLTASRHACMCIVGQPRLALCQHWHRDAVEWNALGREDVGADSLDNWHQLCGRGAQPVGERYRFWVFGCLRCRSIVFTAGSLTFGQSNSASARIASASARLSITGMFRARRAWKILSVN
jgi:hypothetical protein